MIILMTKKLKNPKITPGEDEEEDFEIENIVEKRVNKKGTFYKVKWLNYDSSENTWINKKNLKNAQDLIDEFESAPKKKSNGIIKRIFLPNKNDKALPQSTTPQTKEVQGKPKVIDTIQLGEGEILNITGVTEVNFERMCVVTYGNEVKQIKYDTIRKDYPMQLISFFESCARFVKIKNYDVATGSFKDVESNKE